MTTRAAAALAVTAALLVYVGAVLPARTERLIAELRANIANDPLARLAFYKKYLDVSVTVVAVFAATVWLGGAGFAGAGVAWPPYATARLLPSLVAGIAILGAVVGLAWLFGHRRDPAAFEYDNQYARIEFVIPRSRKEKDLWPLFCLAVAVVEEVLYRGLFVLYAATLLGFSPWWLVVPMALVFGQGHRYQGWLGVVTTTGTGLMLSVVTVATGSLWPAVVVHALVDFRVMLLKPPAPAAPTSAAGWAPPPPPPA